MSCGAVTHHTQPCRSMLKKWSREESMGKASDADLGSVLGAVFLVLKICPAVTPEDKFQPAHRS